jgi:small subunit ribosomal protein S21
MSEIKIGDQENFEVALKRFNRKITQDGILSEARRRMHFQSAGEKRKQRNAAALKRKRKNNRKPTNKQG